MFKHIAALGIGLGTLVAAPLALAAPCDSPHPSAAHAAHAAHAARATQPRPAQPPRIVAQQVALREAKANRQAQQVALRQADVNRDGGVTYREAHVLARTQFQRADRDHDGALTPSELRHSSDAIESVSRGRDNIVTLSEVDAATRDQFSRLDTNRDGVLRRRELGLSAPRTVRTTRHWSS
jgi:EF-hand domain pair